MKSFNALRLILWVLSFCLLGFGSAPAYGQTVHLVDSDATFRLEAWVPTVAPAKTSVLIRIRVTRIGAKTPCPLYYANPVLDCYGGWTFDRLDETSSASTVESTSTTTGYYYLSVTPNVNTDVPWNVNEYVEFDARVTTPAAGPASVAVAFEPFANGQENLLVNDSVVGITGAPSVNSDESTGTFSGKGTAGDPIDVGTGDVSSRVSDYESAGANRLSFARTYNSHATTNPFFSGGGMIGSNWSSTFDRYLIANGSGQIGALRPDGQILLFTQSGSAWTPPPGVTWQLQVTSTTWTLSDPVSGTTETYIPGTWAHVGLLSSVRQRNGYAQTCGYNSAFDLTSVKDSYGRALELSYNGNGLLNSLTTPEGNVIEYTYDSPAAYTYRLRSVTYLESPDVTVGYEYQDASYPLALTGVKDENGYLYSSFTYDSEGRGTSSELGGGADLTKLAYNSDGSTTLTNPLGEQETYYFEVLNGEPKVSEIVRAAGSNGVAPATFYDYDGNGYCSGKVDWLGNETVYTNDSLGRQTSKTEGYGTPAQRTMTTTYLGSSNLPINVSAPGLTTAFTYDSQSNLLTKTETDETGGITQGQTRKWSYTWASGLMTSFTTPLGATTAYGYADGALSSSTNALGQTVRAVLSPGGLRLQVTDANGIITNFTYDYRQRLTSTATSLGWSISETRATYDAAGNMTLLSSPNGSALKMTYDTAHRLVSTTDLLGEKVALQLNAVGGQIGSSISSSAGVVTNTSSQTFDPLGRLTASVAGAGQTQRFTYDNDDNLLTGTSGVGHVQSAFYDPLNRPVQSMNALEGLTTASLTAEDQIASATDPNGSSSLYSYDGFGDLLSLTSPDSGKSSYKFDADGNCLSKTDANGTVSNYANDKLDRVISITYPADATENVHFSYDQTAHGFGVGHLTSVTDAAGTLSLSYDALGHETSATRQIGAANLTTEYTYDLSGRVIGLRYPSGFTVTYVRNTAGNCTSVLAQFPGSAQSVTLASNIAYEPFGPETGLMFGNGIAEKRAFDDSYRLTRIVTEGTEILQNLAYGYDADNNVSSLTDLLSSANNQSFSYDATDRLVGAKGSYGTVSFGYDPNGNRLQETVAGVKTSYGYASLSNRLTSVGTGAVVSTKAGSISSLGSISLSYNAAGRLSKTQSGGKTVGTYLYDAFGARTSKATASGTTVFQYDQSGHLLEEAGPTGTALQDYVYLDDGRPIATFVPATNQTYFIHTDALSTPRILTDAHQNVVWTASYKPFGEPVAVAGSGTMNLRFPGQYLDSETGLSQNGARDYSPGLGRYVESDPIGLGGGLNTYGYALGNPLCYIDRQGRNPLIIGAIVVGVIVGGVTYYNSTGTPSQRFKDALGVGIPVTLGLLLPALAPEAVEVGAVLTTQQQALGVAGVIGGAAIDTGFGLTPGLENGQNLGQHVGGGGTGSGSGSGSGSCTRATINIPGALLGISAGGGDPFDPENGYTPPGDPVYTGGQGPDQIVPPDMGNGF